MLVATVLHRIRPAPNHQIKVVRLRAKTVSFGGALISDGMRLAGLSLRATYLDQVRLRKLAT